MDNELNKLAKKYIQIAENQFGKTCSNWKFIGVEINNQGPHVRYYPDKGELAISLSEKSLENELELHCQLAHEACHTLYPTVEPGSNVHIPATVLNEGISTYFQMTIISDEKIINQALENLKNNASNYYKAFILVAQLLMKDPEAIKKLRAIQPKLNNICFNDFVQAGLDIPSEVINNLLCEFV